MARRQNYVWFTATTRWGSVRIRVPLDLYQRATACDRDNKLLSKGTGARDHICIRVRQRLNSAGGQVQFVRWQDIAISDIVISSDPEADTESVALIPRNLLYEAQVVAIVDSSSEPTADELSEVAELFPELLRATRSKAMDDTDFICGCVPFSITE